MLGLNSTLGFLLSLGLFTSDSPKIIAQTEYGKVEGTTSTTRNGRTVYEFLGIPYAVPPLGELRFRPPVAWNTTWDDVRDASTYNNKCKQFHLIGKFITGSEDCLYLNIYTHRYLKEEDVISNINTSNPLNEREKEKLSPVIVYIHGGLFMHGSGEWYKPKYLLDSDVVLVTINYRLGAFGFLNLGAENINGNAGLKDQVAALKYIQRNIRYFGGDPEMVTIMGESAGAASVHYMMLYGSRSRGLFHRAISQSGNAFVSWASQDNPRDQALWFASQMNCLKPTMAKIAKCLRNLDADKIAKSQRSASDLLHHRYALYAPTIEKPSEDAFISDSPENIIKSGNIAKVPWLVGANSEEGLIYAAPILRNETIREELNKNWKIWAPILFRFADEPNKTEIAEQIWSYYLGGPNSEINMTVLHNLTTFLSDRSFFEGLHNSLELHRGQHPIYPYIYNYEGKFSFAQVLFGMTFSLPIYADVVVSRIVSMFQSLYQKSVSYGVAHGDELPLLFNLPFQTELKEKGKTYGDYDMSKTLVETWTAFAREGVPSPINNVTWPVLNAPNNETSNHSSTEVNKGTIKFLRVNRVSEVIEEPFHPRSEFWRSLNLLPYKIGENSQTNGNCTETGNALSCNPTIPDNENVVNVEI